MNWLTWKANQCVWNICKDIKLHITSGGLSYYGLTTETDGLKRAQMAGTLLKDCNFIYPKESVSPIDMENIDTAKWTWKVQASGYSCRCWCNLFSWKVSLLLGHSTKFCWVEDEGWDSKICCSLDLYCGTPPYLKGIDWSSTIDWMGFEAIQHGGWVQRQGRVQVEQDV